MTTYEWFVKYLTVSGSARHGNVWQCPAHHDASPSLSVSQGDGGRVLLHCHAGCSVQAVLDAMGLGLRALFESPPWSPEEVLARQISRPKYPCVEHTGRGGRHRGAPITTTHHVYIPGNVRLERNRYADGRKSCRWERRVGPDWVYGLGIRSLTSLPLYERTQLEMGLGAGWPIVLCESESSVDAILDAGVFATTWAGGAASPPLDRLRRNLAGATVVWIPDNDDAGQCCSVQVVAALDPVCSLRTIVPAQGQDARDLLVLLGGETFRDIIDGRVPAP